MYVPVNGLAGRRRRGMGVTTVDACTCVQNVCVESGNDCLVSSGAVAAPLMGSTAGSIIPGIPNLVAGALGFVALILVMKGGR